MKTKIRTVPRADWLFVVPVIELIEALFIVFFFLFSLLQLESHRLHQSLDVANKAARKMQQLSKRMLSNIATDLIRSGKR